MKNYILNKISLMAAYDEKIKKDWSFSEYCEIHEYNTTAGRRKALKNITSGRKIYNFFRLFKLQDKIIKIYFDRFL